MAKKGKAQLRAEAAAKQTKLKNAYIDLVAAISDDRALELLKPEEVQNLIGKNADDFTITIIESLQRQRLKQIRSEKLQSAADWIKSLIITTYPKNDVIIKRGNIIQIYLDGLPAETI